MHDVWGDLEYIGLNPLFVRWSDTDVLFSTDNQFGW